MCSQQTKPITMTTTVKNDDDNNEGKTCVVCWEDLQHEHTNDSTTGTTTILKPCQHYACCACICNWIERCEITQQEDVRCPSCQQIITNLQDLLGRPYQKKQNPSSTSAPRTATAEGESSLTEADRDTQFWLEENNAHQCTNCGIYMVREDGDETDAVMCLCGWCFCFKCMEDADDCDCNHDEFYDNFLDEDVCIRDGRDHPVATAEDLQDFGAFLQRRQEAAWGEGHSRDEEDEEAPAVEEPAEAHLVALFAEYVEAAEALFVALFEDCTGDAEANVPAIPAVAKKKSKSQGNANTSDHGAAKYPIMAEEVKELSLRRTQTC